MLLLLLLLLHGGFWILIAGGGGDGVSHFFEFHFVSVVFFIFIFVLYGLAS